MNFKEKTKSYIKNASQIEEELLNDIKAEVEQDDLPIKIIDGAIYGSRSRGMQKQNSDLDFVVEYTGDMKEYTVFNILHEMNLTYEGLKVDINPIRKEESGTLNTYLQNADNYMKGKGKDSMNNQGLKQANLLANWFESNGKQLTDIIITMSVKNNDNNIILTIMSDGSITKSTDTVEANKAFANADEVIASFKPSTVKEKDSYPNEAIFNIVIDLNDFSRHFDEDITIENAQNYFDDMIVRKIENGKIYLTYTGDITEDASTVANDIDKKYGTRPISISKKNG